MMRPITLGGLEHSGEYRAFMRKDHVSDKDVLYVCFMLNCGRSDNYVSGDFDQIKRFLLDRYEIVVWDWFYRTETKV